MSFTTSLFSFFGQTVTLSAVKFEDNDKHFIDPEAYTFINSKLT